MPDPRHALYPLAVKPLLPSPLAFALLGAGCAGGGEDGAAARVYLLRDGKVWPVPRDVEEGADAAASWPPSFFGGRARKSASSAS